MRKSEWYVQSTDVCLFLIACFTAAGMMRLFLISYQWPKDVNHFIYPILLALFINSGTPVKNSFYKKLGWPIADKKTQSHNKDKSEKVRSEQTVNVIAHTGDFAATKTARAEEIEKIETLIKNELKESRFSSERSFLLDKNRRVLTEIEFSTIVKFALFLEFAVFFPTLGGFFTDMTFLPIEVSVVLTIFVLVAPIAAICVACDYRKPFVVAEINEKEQLILRLTPQLSHEIKLDWNRVYAIQVVSSQDSAHAEKPYQIDFFDDSGKRLARVQRLTWPPKNFARILQFLRENTKPQTEHRVLD